MLNRNLIFLLLLLNLFFSSCSSVRLDQNQIEINSNPEKSEVSLFSTKTQSYTKLGETPLKLNISKIKKMIDKEDEFIAVKISRRGYVIEHLIIDIKVNHKINYFTSLKSVGTWSDPESEFSSLIANKLTQNLQSLNQKIFKKKYASALATVEQLINQYPKAHMFYDIKGSILYLQGKKAESLAVYRKSLSLNPDNVESQKMLEKIRKQ